MLPTLHCGAQGGKQRETMGDAFSLVTSFEPLDQALPEAQTIVGLFSYESQNIPFMAQAV